MKSAGPIAHGVRRGLGEALCNRNYTARPLASLIRTSPQSFTRHPSQCAQRHNSSTAASTRDAQLETSSTASPKQSMTSISDQVRLLMRRVPYPVAIITATDPSGPQETSFRGMTVSSFSTVTLTPHPVISFNVRRPSETLNALLASRRFLVHLLAPGPATATLARDFSKGNATLTAMLSGHGEFEFAALDAGNERPLPILRRKGSGDSNADFPFVLECTLHPEKIDVHDHSIVLGTVVRTIEGPEPEASGPEGRVDEHSPDRLCLAYANTKFWKMGGEI
ncbi:FMN-binding split barrel-like protein [Penicillium brevicompactum]|uniref:FMN-binding split barrel-like protein n=1 Tax=Penicillium brevicompactum TaxID=5074 RepID=A0A9W9QSU9_PENBR|nr:FMN-binding split barrel-like protein [Penicillium brevicompactum]